MRRRRQHLPDAMHRHRSRLHDDVRRWPLRRQQLLRQTCENCPADCATTTAVCGNGECEAGEETTCFNDCGPDPWTWLADEQAMLTEANNARVNGIPCPGHGVAAHRASRSRSTIRSRRRTREWAWEIRPRRLLHVGDAQACNGRTFAQRSAQGGYITALSAFGFASGTAAAQFFETDMASCPTLMDTRALGGQARRDRGWSARLRAGLPVALRKRASGVARGGPHRVERLRRCRRNGAQAHLAERLEVEARPEPCAASEPEPRNACCTAHHVASNVHGHAVISCVMTRSRSDHQLRTST